MGAVISVAILIPTFKPGSYIESCFDSIEKQDFSKVSFVVYIALNGSDEAYRHYLTKTLSNYTFKYKLFCLSEAGVSAARNFLIDNSCSDYVCFVDDDDIISNDYLTGLFQASSEDIIGVANVKVFNHSFSNSVENYIGRYFLRLKHVESSLLRSRKYFSSPCAKMIHRSIIADVRFDTNLTRGEDALFMAMLSPRVVSVRKSLTGSCYYVYQRPGSATRKKIDRVQEIKRIFYLSNKYLKMFFIKDYDSFFIASRLVATLFQLKGVFK